MIDCVFVPSLQEIEAQLTAVGGPCELCEDVVLGARMQVFKRRAPSLRALVQDSARFGDVEYLVYEDRLLIVDDVFDTGYTIQALIRHLREKSRLNTPGDIRVAVPYYKPTRNETDLEPDYYLHETDRWIKFPYSLEGLAAEEIREKRPEIYEVIKSSVAKANG